jgi:hypothetical protein
MDGGEEFSRNDSAHRAARKCTNPLNSAQPTSVFSKSTLRHGKRAG